MITFPSGPYVGPIALYWRREMSQLNMIFDFARYSFRLISGRYNIQRGRESGSVTGKASTSAMHSKSWWRQGCSLKKGKRPLEACRPQVVVIVFQLFKGRRLLQHLSKSPVRTAHHQGKSVCKTFSHHRMPECRWTNNWQCAGGVAMLWQRPICAG
jgi:hypothetical protein